MRIVKPDSGARSLGRPQTPGRAGASGQKGSVMLRTHGVGTMSVAVITAVCLLSTGCGRGQVSAPQREPSPAFSGKDLFTGVFFGRGAVASRLPGLWGEAGRVAQAEAWANNLSRTELVAHLERISSSLAADPALADRAPTLRSLAESLRAGNTTFLARDEMKGVSHALQDTIVSSIEGQDPSFFDWFAREIQSGNQLRVQEALQLGAKNILEVTKSSAGEASLVTRSTWWVVDTVVFVVGVVAVAVVAIVALVVMPDPVLQAQPGTESTQEYDSQVKDITAK